MSYGYLNQRVRGRARTYGNGGRAHPKMRSRTGWNALGDLFDDARALLQQDAPNAACDAMGRSAQGYYDTQLQQITQAWKQTDGFYYVTDMRAILQQGLAFQQAGQNLLDKLTATYGDFGQASLKSAKDQAQNDLFDVGKNALDFTNAMNTADASGATVVDAQGLKDWVIDAISAAGRAAYVSAYTQCAMPAGAAAIIAVAALFDAAGKAFIAVLGKTLKVVLAAGDVIYKTTVGTLDLVATVVKYAPWIAGAYGLSWLWKNYGKR